jgi:hypothetical protein
MERSPLIDLRVPPTGSTGTALDVLDRATEPDAALAAVPDRAPSPLQLWAWRAVVTLAVALTVAGMAVWASSPPA